MNEWIHGVGNLLIYLLSAVIVVLSIRKFTNIGDELYRKLLHFVLLGSLFLWTVSFSSWQIKVLTVIGFVGIVYPILMFFERFRTYSRMVDERKKGELKKSLIVVFLMFALVLAVAEGIFDDRCLTLASVYAWGVGDAFAALIGKKYGRHKLTGRFLSGKKSLEGTIAMFLTSFVSVLLLLLRRGGVHSGWIVLTAAVTAAVSAVCELYTKDGMDTLTCPLVSMAVMIAMLFPAGGL